jgi:putative ABC transport system permease protein
VLGTTVARELFPAVDPVGRIVRVGGARMRVIGVIEPRGTQLGLDMNEVVVVPVATAMRLFDRRSLFRIMIQVRSHADLPAARTHVLALLTERHGEEDVTTLTQDAVVAAFSAILRALTLALAAIAAISLSVAGIGIMNVMLVSVAERTPEVGLLKAVGVGRGQILGVFLTEAALLSSAGGVLGLLVGWFGVRILVGIYPALPAAPPRWAVVASLAVSVAVGVLFGLLPARRATRLDPVAALARR